MQSLPLHKYSNYFYKLDFFNGIEDFSDLEKKIINQTTPNGLTKELIDGYAMEVFSEAFLNLHFPGVKKVWPQGYVPIDILKKYNLPKRDKGYDGVVLDKMNNLHTYQVKFRTNKENLTWDKLSTFAGVGEGIKSRILIYNGNKVDSYFKSKKEIILYRGLDFDSLKKINYTNIYAWLTKEKKQNTNKSFLVRDVYQIKTTKKVLKEFQKQNRTTIILACGLGKTLIGMDIFEKLKPNLTVVFVPSIALIRQTRLDWIQTSDVKFTSLAVCSINDRDAKNDEASFEESDLNFKITTKPEEIKNWIKSNKLKKRVIFTTYQSSKKLCEGSKNITYDFGIYDEAHRTASVTKQHNQKSYFSYPLYEHNISIKKRLFMTATRRVSNRNRFFKEGDKMHSYSMDNKDLYGEVCQNISFLEGAKLNIIAKPKVIISTITSKDINKHLIDKGITSIEGENSKVFQIATQIAIKRAIKKHKIKKIFSFHSSVKRSESFTSNRVEGIRSQIPSIISNHIDGSYKLEDRENILKSFKQSKLSIISNVRCLVEGVNVPEVDAVVFTTPKESLIDIIQAIGRSLRKRQNKKKKYGYVILPIYLDLKNKEKISKNLEKNNFDLIADIINALREHDEEINQIIEKAIINQKIHKGYGFKRKRDDFDELIELNSDFIDLKILQKAIRTKILKKLTTKWEEMVSNLLSYKDKFGDFRIRPNQKIFQDLFKWMDGVRRRYRDGSLPNYKFIQLEKIKFPFQFDDEEIKSEDYDQFISLWDFYDKFQIKPPSNSKRGNSLYLENFCNQNEIKLLKGYARHTNKKGSPILRSYYLNIKEFRKYLKNNKIIFDEEIKNISKDNEKLINKKETSKILGLSLKKTQIFLKKLINNNDLKIAFFVFGSKFKKNHGLKDYKDKSICFNFLFYKKDILKIKERTLPIDDSVEISLKSVSKKYNIDLGNYPKAKLKFYKRRKANTIELVDCVNLNELNIFFKNFLKINLNEKIIEDKKLLNLSNIRAKLENLGYKNETVPTILSKYKKLKIIEFAGNYFRKNKEEGTGVEKYFFSDFEDKLSDYLKRKYASTIKGFNSKKKLLLNNTENYLKKKNILTDDDIIKILKINTGDRKIDQRLVRSLRANYSLYSYCYIRNMGNPGHGTKKEELEKFIKSYGYFYTSNVSNLISHKIISKYFKQFNFYNLFKENKIKSAFFFTKKNEGNITFLASENDYLTLIKNQGYFKKGATTLFKKKFKQSIVETNKYLKN